MKSPLAPLAPLTTTYIGGLAVLFFLVPYLPKSVLMLTDFLLVRLALLASLVLAVRANPLVGILYFLVLANLFIQRNNQKMMRLVAAMQQSKPSDEAIQSIETPATAPVQPLFLTPTERSTSFMPQDDSGENAFHAIAESINHKDVLPTESVDGSDKAISQLFGWVNTSLVQES